MYTIVDNLGLATLAGMMDACSERSSEHCCSGCRVYSQCRKLWTRACLAATDGQFQDSAVTASLQEFKDLVKKEARRPGLGLVPWLPVEPGSAGDPDGSQGFIS